MSLLHRTKSGGWTGLFQVLEKPSVSTKWGPWAFFRQVFWKVFAVCQCDTVVQYKIIKAGYGSFCHCAAVVAQSWKHFFFFSEKAMKVCEVCIWIYIMSRNKREKGERELQRQSSVAFVCEWWLCSRIYNVFPTPIQLTTQCFNGQSRQLQKSIPQRERFQHLRAFCKAWQCRSSLEREEMSSWEHPAAVRSCLLRIFVGEAGLEREWV